MHRAITVGCKANLKAPLGVYVRAKLLSMRWRVQKRRTKLDAVVDLFTASSNKNVLQRASKNSTCCWKL